MNPHKKARLLLLLLRGYTSFFSADVLCHLLQYASVSEHF